MIRYDPLWETMKKRGISQYKLLKDYHFSAGQLSRLRKNENISTYTISKEDLLKWADEVLAPTAQLAYVGKGEFNAGDHCTFCKVKATCRKRAEYNLELAKYDFEMPATLDDTEIAAILEKVDKMISWGNDIKDYALQQAQSGVHFEGWKIVEGRSNRKYTDENAGRCDFK